MWHQMTQNILWLMDYSTDILFVSRIPNKDTFYRRRRQYIQTWRQILNKICITKTRRRTEKIFLSRYRHEKWILPWRTEKGILLIKWQALNTVSAYNYFGTCIWIIMVQTTSRLCLCLRSTTPFYWDVWVQKVWWISHS